MDAAKRKRLEAAGWKVGDAADFLELTDTERRFVELRAKLAAAVRRLRRRAGLSQSQVARQIETSQPRMTDIEAGVSTLDLMFRAFYGLGGELARLDELGAPLSAEERVERVASKSIPRARTEKPRASKAPAVPSSGKPVQPDAGVTVKEKTPNSRSVRKRKAPTRAR